MAAVQQLVIGLLIGAGLGLLYGRAKNMAPWVRQSALSADEQEMLALMRAVEPKLRSLEQVFTDWPDAFGVLDEIVGQLTANGGQTMADAVRRLDKAAIVSAKAASDSAKAAEQLNHSVRLIDAKLTLSAASGMRTEARVEDAAVLAAGVAQALDDSQHEARAVSTTAPSGAAADAGSRGPDPEGVSNTTSIGDASNEQP